MIKENIKTNLKSLRLIFEISKMQVLMLVFVILFQGLLPITSASLSASIIDYLAGSNQWQRTHLLYLCILWGGTLLLYDLIGPLIMFLQSNIADIAVFKINQQIIQKSSLTKGLEFFENPKFHDDMKILISQASHKPLNFVVTLVGLLRDLVIVVSCIAILFKYISWICLIPLCAAFLHSSIIAKLQEAMWQESLGRSKQSRFMNYIASLSINTSFVKELKLFPIHKFLIAKYDALFKNIYKSMYRLRFKQILLPIFPIVLYISANVFGIFYISEKVMSGVFSIGVIALLVQTLALMHQSVGSFGEQYGWLTGHILFFEKYFKFMTYGENIQKAVKPKYIDKSSPPSITFKNVSFTYPGETAAVLQNVSFKINPQEKIAIVGMNGCGKSTIIKLICRFYDPSEGQILLNDIPITEYDIDDLRCAIAPVFQDYGKFFLTAEENIVMGDLQKSEFISPCLSSAGADFANDLPQGLKTPLGKEFGGTDLSLGQWQKLAIARALYKNGELLILDEPTASLDPISEGKLQENFINISSGKTVIFVTHRLSSVTIADKILVLKNGRVKGFADHNKLLKESSFYRKMYGADGN